MIAFDCDPKIRDRRVTSLGRESIIQVKNYLLNVLLPFLVVLTHYSPGNLLLMLDANRVFHEVKIFSNWNVLIENEIF